VRLRLRPRPHAARGLGALEVALESGLEVEELEMDASGRIGGAGKPEGVARGGRVLVELAVPPERLLVVPLAGAAVPRHEAGVAVHEALMSRFGQGRGFLYVPQGPIEIATLHEGGAEEGVGDREQRPVADLGR
jgi:hypothetical protein